MGYDLNIHLEQKQELMMTPELQLAIKVLQYSTMELNQFIEKMYNNNPLLEIKWKQEGSNYSNGNHNYDRNYNYENFISEKTSLLEFLEGQLYFTILESEKRIARFIIGNLDEHGFLKYDSYKIAEVLAEEVNVIESIIKKIQELDPPGIAAKDFRQALLIQLKRIHRDTSLEEKLVSNYVNELAEGNIKRICKITGADKEKIELAVKTIKSLNPYPASGFYQGQDTNYIVPDLVVKEEDGEFVLEYVGVLPEVKISNYYSNLMKKCKSSENLKYLKSQYSSAIWLIKSIEQRQRTVSKIAKALIKGQEEFLRKGNKYLRSMNQSEIAVKVGVHVSTVSRACREKYIQTPQGLFELKFFFNSGIKKYSSYSIKAYILEIIKGEDREQPYSDCKISSLLSTKLNINISRRTVAKYRNELGLPSSNKRKVL
ncbi:MAG: RNA polymerase factor sigma-54 [Halanaerobiales bacterium]